MHPESNVWISDLRLKGVILQRTIELIRAVLRVARHDPPLAREVAQGFCQTASLEQASN